MKVWLFHGFLGKPQDFSEIIAKLPLELEVKAWDLHKMFDELNFKSKSELLRFFVEQAGKDEILLCGYSMAGRIALELSAQLKGQIRGLLMFSSHFGLISSTERENRVKSDRNWVSSFKNEDWQIVMQKWNNQGVFSGDECFTPSSEDFSLNSIEYFLTEFSLGNQPDFRSHLENFSLPWKIICGAKDEKFVNLWTVFCRDLNREDQLKIISDVGHRNLSQGGHFLLDFVREL